MSDSTPSSPSDPDGSQLAATLNGGQPHDQRLLLTTASAPAVGQGQNQGGDQGSGTQATGSDSGDGIAGMSVLRGLIVYTAVLAFAGLYIDFIALISRAQPNHVASIDSAKITAAAALAGVLGSAFALRVGNPSAQLINLNLHAALMDINDPKTKTPTHKKLGFYVHRALSLETSRPNRKSWPVTVGIWVYAAVGSAVAITYALNENETPASIKALAVTFAGYVVAFLSVAFGQPRDSATGATASPNAAPPQTAAAGIIQPAKENPPQAEPSGETSSPDEDPPQAAGVGETPSTEDHPSS